MPDKKSYQPGETAHVLAMLPTTKAHLLVTTELTGVLTARHVDSPSRGDDRRADRGSIRTQCLSDVAYVKDGEMYTHDRLLECAGDEQVS